MVARTLRQKGLSVAIGGKNLLRDCAEPEDVAPVVVFLASDAARMVTGATYDVTGGDNAHNAT